MRASATMMQTKWRYGIALTLAALCGMAGCVPVRPEQRAILAEPSMRFDQTTADSRANARVLENREGATGGGALKGGGCGCN